MTVLPTRLGKYMWAVFRPASNRKTDIWSIEGRSGVLGYVRWHGPWRGYAMFPEPNTIFNATCLRELASFTDEQTRLHKHERGNDE